MEKQYIYLGNRLEFEDLVLSKGTVYFESEKIKEKLEKYPTLKKVLVEIEKLPSIDKNEVLFEKIVNDIKEEIGGSK